MTRIDPVVSTFSGVRVAPSYQEVPEQQVPAMRATADLALRRVNTESPWRPFVTKALLPDDVVRYREGRGGGTTTGLADPTVNLTGPSTLPAGYWMPADHSAPTPPADVTWTATRALTPRELLTITSLSSENYGVLIGFDDLDANGQPTLGDRPRADPIVVGVLADAVIRTENMAFATGAATNADPFQGLNQMAGFTALASTANLVDDLIEAVFELVAAKRPPNAAFVPVRLAKKIRKAKASTGGSYLFEPDEPLQIVYGPGEADVVPIIPLDGLPNTAGSTAFVGDFRKLVVLWRIMPNGRLLMAAESAYGATFNTDRITIRLTERLDMAVIPGYEPSFIKLTGVDAS